MSKNNFSNMLAETFEEGLDELVYIHPDMLEPDPNQDRKDFDSPEAESYLKELADSASTIVAGKPYGIRRPLEVYKIDGSRKFRIGSGENRWRAAILAGLDEVPCLIRTNISDETASLDQLTENLTHRKLNLWELANALQTRIDKGIDKKVLLSSLGKKKAWLSKYTAVLKMDQDLQNLASNNLVKDVETLRSISKIDSEGREQLIIDIEKGVNPKLAIKNVVKHKPTGQMAKSQKNTNLSLSMGKDEIRKILIDNNLLPKDEDLSEIKKLVISIK